MTREGWAAAVGQRYKTKNGTVVLIGRYTVTLTGAVIEGRLADQDSHLIVANNSAPAPDELPFSWDEKGNCTSRHNVLGSDFDLQNLVVVRR